MVPPPQRRPTHAALPATAGLVFVLVTLAAGCGGGESLEPAPQRTITLKAGDTQEALAGSAVPIAPSVTVTEVGGGPVAGVPVTFQVTSGGGSVAPSTAINTDGQGTAAVTSWTLGIDPGANTLSASAVGVTGSPVVFTATAVAAATIRGTITISNELSSVKAAAAGLDRRLGVVPIPAPRGLRRPKHAREELIVRFSSRAVGAPSRGASALALRSAAAAVGSKIRARMASHISTYAATLIGVSPGISTARLRVEHPADMAALAAALRADPAVATVEQNGITWSAVARRAPANPGAARLSRASNDPFGPFQAWHYGMIDLPEAWNITTGSAGVLVALIDDGIRFDHPDIAANLTLDGFDFVSDDARLSLCSGGSLNRSGDGDGYDDDPTIPTSYGYDPVGDCLTAPLAFASNGVIDAGILGAVGNDGVGVAGINWLVRIRPLRVLAIDGVGTDYDVAQGILYAAGLPADNGHGGVVQAPAAAKLINLNISSTEENEVVRDAVLAATGAGALIIGTAGFSGSSSREYPAIYPEVLAVSALRPDRELAFYASSGSTVDIAAPGGDFSNGNTSFGVVSTAWDFVAGSPTYAASQGTSVAHVTGVAALLLAQNSGLTSLEIRSRLTDYAVDAGTQGRDDRYGAGIVNARNSLAQNFEPPRQLHARLYDALTGAAVQAIRVAEDGSYSFTANPGSYQVFAGQDEDGNGVFGLPGQRWGAFGGSTRPSRIDVTTGGSHEASFSVGFASEREPNETLTDANFLPVGGYLSGVVSAPEGGDTDVFQVLIAQPGQYTFETSAVDGACGFALEEDTFLGLYRADETLVGVNDDVDLAASNFCSRVSASLERGTYYLRVSGYSGGRYRVQARSGS